MSVKIVPYSDKVFNQLVVWQEDDDLRKDMGGLSIPMREDELKFSYDQFLKENSAVMGVQLGETIIGAFIMEMIQPIHKRVNCHVVFDKKFRHLVNIASEKFLDLIFNELGFNSIHAFAPANNEKNIAYLESYGFKKRGTIPEYYTFQDGVVSAYYYSLMKSKRVKPVRHKEKILCLQSQQ